VKYEAYQLEELLAVSKDRAFFCHPIMKSLRQKSLKCKDVEGCTIQKGNGTENLPQSMQAAKRGSKK
jgi:hypothetical protein